MMELLDKSKVMPSNGHLTKNELNEYLKDVFRKSMVRDYKAMINKLKNISKKEKDSLNILCKNYEFGLLDELIKAYE